MATRFLSGYYLANAALLASFGLLHASFTPADAAAPERRGRISSLLQLHTLEKQCALALAALVALRLWRRRSWDGAVAQALFYAKVVLAVLAYMIDPRLAGWYALAFWAVYVLLPQPIVDLAASGIVEQLTPTTLKEASLASDCSWLVFFYTQSHSTSVAAAPAFLQVAEEFASPKLRFGAFDVCVWPRTAAEMRLTTNTWSNQLPSVVMFDKGKEWGRMPPVEAASDPTKQNNYTRRDIVRLFRIEERFARPLQAGSGAAAAAPGAAKPAKAR